ncbi:hypothetical protein CDV31_017141, partial [Fusarium ambrosium]
QELGRLPPFDYPKDSPPSPYRVPPQESRPETDFQGSDGPRYTVTWADFSFEGGLALLHSQFPGSREHPILIVDDNEEPEDTVKMEDQCSPPQMTANCHEQSPAASSLQFPFLEDTSDPPTPQATAREHAHAVSAGPTTDPVAVDNSPMLERAHFKPPPLTVKQVQNPP